MENDLVRRLVVPILSLTLTIKNPLNGNEPNNAPSTSENSPDPTTTAHSTPPPPPPPSPPPEPSPTSDPPNQPTTNQPSTVVNPVISTDATSQTPGVTPSPTALTPVVSNSSGSSNTFLSKGVGPSVSISGEGSPAIYLSSDPTPTSSSSDGSLTDPSSSSPSLFAPSTSPISEGLSMSHTTTVIGVVLGIAIPLLCISIFLWRRRRAMARRAGRRLDVEEYYRRLALDKVATTSVEMSMSSDDAPALSEFILPSSSKPPRLPEVAFQQEQLSMSNQIHNVLQGSMENDEVVDPALVTVRVEGKTRLDWRP